MFQTRRSSLSKERSDLDCRSSTSFAVACSAAPIRHTVISSPNQNQNQHSIVSKHSPKLQTDLSSLRWTSSFAAREIFRERNSGVCPTSAWKRSRILSLWKLHG